MKKLWKVLLQGRAKKWVNSWHVGSREESVSVGDMITCVCADGYGEVEK